MWLYFFLRLILFFFFAIMIQKMITSDQAPKTYFFALLHLELFPWRHVMKRTKRKKNFICMSLWKFRFLEDQGQNSIDPSMFKLSEYDMICNVEVKAHQSWQLKNVTCLLYLTFRWVHEFLPAVSLSCPILGRWKNNSNDFSMF